MKFVNFYSGTALVLIASLLGSLGSTTGEMAPPLIVGALLLTVLVLGWAGGASDARHELDRLTRLEAGRQLKATCDAAARDRLEAMNEALRAQARDSQAAIELFTAVQVKNMIRITALEGENAELQKRPSSDVMMVTAQRLIAELNDEPDDVDEDCRNYQVRGIGHLHSELLMHMATTTPTPAAIGNSLAGSVDAASTCGCHACLHIAGTTTVAGMVLCPACGCKRCPHANDHRHACTGSNEPGQPGSAYPVTLGAPAAKVGQPAGI